MNLILQYGLLGLVLGLGLGLGFILYCKIWRPLALPYMCPQPFPAQLCWTVTVTVQSTASELLTFMYNSNLGIGLYIKSVECAVFLTGQLFRR